MAEAAVKKLTIFDLQAKVDRGEKVFQVTAVDFPTAQLVDLARKANDLTFAFLVDRVTLTDPERPVLVVNLYGDPGRTFRVIPREMPG